jgi:hypothetical protein
VEVAHCRRRHGAPRIQLRVQPAQRVHCRLALGDVTGEHAVDHDDRAVSEERRQVFQRRQMEQSEPCRELVGRVAGQAVPGTEHLGVALEGPQEHAAVELAVRKQAVLERGDDSKAASAAP